MDFLEKSTMNLKEGFRYQNFLNTLMAEAETYRLSAIPDGLLII